MRNHRRKLLWLTSTALCLALLAWLGHLAIRQAARIPLPAGNASIEDNERLDTGASDIKRWGTSSVRRHGGILEVRLTGTPQQIGLAHTKLLYPRMVENEGVLLGHFERMVPNSWARTALVDLALLRYRNVHQGMSQARLTEIAAMARAFRPDPYADFFATFQRFVYLNALYDISLSFEHSPLIGCTSFVLNARAGGTGDPMLARNFDFEVDPIFDRQKAVFLVREQGRIPFASVAWPGLLGVVSGMNAEGLALVVHGARAAEPANHGEPVAHSLRRALSGSRTVDEAVRALKARPAMVSHLVVIMDATGRAAVVERAPGNPVHSRELSDHRSVTNHFQGPLAADPKNQRVRETTSTLQRRARADELVKALPEVASETDAVALLRDRRGVGDQQLPLGDRRAIDALIATHGVVMNTRQRQLWVSEGPHLLGRFVQFDLLRLLGPNPPETARLRTLPRDPRADSLRRRLEH